jgi:hypothetical protein
MMASDSVEWFGVRCVFRQASNQPWGPYDLREGESAYEERITVWQAESAAHAIELAEVDAHLYEEALLVEYLGIAQSYRLPDQLDQGSRSLLSCPEK